MVGSSSTRSESEKEKTKLRERQRRAITTKIFHGLRRHGGYHLTPRSDINEVLRELAKEAGWIVEPDGTTYRYKNRCPTCGAMPNNTSTNTTPTTSSTVIAGGRTGVGAGGECSTTTSPCCIDPMTMMINTNSNGEPTTTATSPTYICTDGSGGSDGDIPLAFYMYRGLAGGITYPPTTTVTAVGGGMKVPTHEQQQGTYMQEARESNESTPEGSPLRRTN